MALRVSPRSPYEEYQVGQTLDLKPDDLHNSFSSPTARIPVRIRQLHTQTLSCTMVVDMLDSNGSVSLSSSPAFLKLFDRRFATQHRRDNGINPWTPEDEKVYVDALAAGTLSQFLDDLHHVANYQEDTEDDWDDAQIEAFLADEQLRLYKTETRVYDILQEYQGSLIPKLHAAVTLELSPPAADASGKHEGGQGDMGLLHVKGILLQYIEGFDLGKLPGNAPKDKWQDIVDQAVAIVRDVGSHHILNRDIRPENFMVTQTGDGAYRVFMIDFALCRFKGENESDSEWARAKYTKDEEGAIGLVMQKRLSNACGFELRYEDSLRWYLEEVERGE